MNNNSIFERTATYMRASYIYHIRRYYAYLEELLTYEFVYLHYLCIFFREETIGDDIFSSQ